MRTQFIVCALRDVGAVGAVIMSEPRKGSNKRNGSPDNAMSAKRSRQQEKRYAKGPEPKSHGAQRIVMLAGGRHPGGQGQEQESEQQWMRAATAETNPASSYHRSC
eukprot:2349201-Amphidinium_carterae.3